jgi:hypothetical protein
MNVYSRHEVIIFKLFTITDTVRYFKIVSDKFNI